MRLRIGLALIVAVTLVGGAFLVRSSGESATRAASDASEASPWPVIVKQRAVQPTKDSRAQRDWVPVAAGNLEMVVAPFPDVLKDSAAVIEGDVIDVSEPLLNLPSGATYDPFKEYGQFLTYHTATISVGRWLMTDGSIAGDQVKITVPGGCYKDTITAEEIADLGYSDEPDVVAPGDVICRGEDAYGGLHFDVGDKVALLLVNWDFPFADGSQQTVMVSAFGVGLLEEKPDGTLVQPGLEVKMESAPDSIDELEQMVQGVAG